MYLKDLEKFSEIFKSFAELFDNTSKAARGIAEISANEAIIFSMKKSEPARMS